MSTEALEARFETTMRDIYWRASSECRYRPAFFLRMVGEHGGVGAARAMISGTASEGFAKLRDLGRLDLSVETLVLQERWRVLFTDEERALARQRLDGAQAARSALS